MKKKFQTMLCSALEQNLGYDIAGILNKYVT